MGVQLTLAPAFNEGKHLDCHCQRENRLCLLIMHVSVDEIEHQHEQVKRLPTAFDTCVAQLTAFELVQVE